MVPLFECSVFGSLLYWTNPLFGSPLHWFVALRSLLRSLWNRSCFFQSSSSSVNSSSDGGELPCGVAKMRLSSTVVGDFSIAKRLTMLLFACLRASGTMRLFVEAARFDVKTRDFYATLGFMPQGTPAPLVPGPVATTPGDSEESEIIYMVRNF